MCPERRPPHSTGTGDRKDRSHGIWLENVDRVSQLICRSRIGSRGQQPRLIQARQRVEGQLACRNELIRLGPGLVIEQAPDLECVRSGRVCNSALHLLMLGVSVHGRVELIELS